MNNAITLWLLSSAAIAQAPIAVTETRQAARLVWVADVSHPVELRVDYGPAPWRQEHAREVGKKAATMFRLGIGGWATLHAGAELRFGDRKLPAGIWYLGLHRAADAGWSLAIIESAKTRRAGVLPGATRDVKPAVLVPMQLRSGLEPQPQLQITLAPGASPTEAELVLRWDTHSLTATCEVAIESAAAVGAPPAPAFRKLDAKRLVGTASGLRYEELRPGVGARPGPEDKVRVHYVGWLADGTKFDSSLDRKQAATFPVSAVIKGWSEGLQRMRPGAVFVLEVPPELGYGKRGAGRTIPPDATTYYWVELQAIE